MPERQTLERPLQREQQVGGEKPAGESALHGVCRSAGSPQQFARDTRVDGGNSYGEDCKKTRNKSEVTKKTTDRVRGPVSLQK